MNRRPPAVAAWLLGTLGAGSATEDLLGDLSEEYNAGRSSLWFWWQVLAAVAISLVNDVRAHPVLTVRAITVGWLVMFLLNVGGSYLREVVEVSGYPYATIEVPAFKMVDGVKTFTAFVPIDRWRYLYGPLSLFIQIVLAGSLAGWLVGHWHARHRASAVLAFVGFLAAQGIYASSVTPPWPTDAEFMVTWQSAAWARWAFFLAPLVAPVLGGIRTRHLSPPVARE